MEIKPVDQTIKQLLESHFYRIPRFQRPYSWDRENVEDFWNDAIVADDPDYFIGSFVVYKSAAAYGPLYVVDGQQRLTTITLLLAAIRDALDSIGATSLAKGIQQLVERQDINNDLQYVLQTETSYPYLQEHIQKHGTATLNPQLGDEEIALKEAYGYLRAQLLSGIDAIESDASVSEVKKQQKKQAHLLRVRDQVLRLQLILIQLTKEEDAYLIFETLNTRGKDLTVSDLVKNHLMRVLKPKNKGVDAAREKWIQILDLFEKSKSDLDMNRFLHHTWLSRYNYVGEKQLFALIRQKVGQSNAESFLDSLVSDAESYRVIFEPEYGKWTKEERELRDSLNALQIFRVVQSAPMLMAIIRAYRTSKTITLKQAKSILRQMENFHFQFTAITAQRTGGGTAKMYALSARSLHEAKNKDKAAQSFKEFLAKLKERTPSEDEFIAGFKQLRFSEDNTKQRPLIRYVLTRLDAHLRKGSVPDYEKMNIEHIAPQNPATPGAITRVAEIGNLILISEQMNTKLANKPYAKKHQEFLKGGVAVDDVLKKSTSWSDKAIDERSHALAKLAYSHVFAI